MDIHYPFFPFFEIKALIELLLEKRIISKDELMDRMKTFIWR